MNNGLLIQKAYLFAAKAHEGQLRKDGIPYIAHPVAVALELAKNGASDEVICAGFLHDTIEDAGISKEELLKNFTKKTAELVAADSENKNLSWEERKSFTINELSQDSNRDLKLLICADKLDNLRNIQTQQSLIGNAVWDQFKRGKAVQQQYYHTLGEAMRELEWIPMYQEYKKLVKEIFDDYSE